MKRIVIAGAAGVARGVIDIIERRGEYAISGLIDNSRPVGESLFGYPVLGRDEDLAALASAHSFDAAAIAIGDNWTRHQVFERFRGVLPNLEFPPVLDSSVYVARGARIGRGTIAGAGAVFGIDTHVGDFAFLGYHASVGEDGWVGDFATLGSSAAMAGASRLGSFSVLSIGASVIQGVSIGEHSVVGASAAVIRDIGDHVIAVGVPARTIRKRRAGDAYL